MKNWKQIVAALGAAVLVATSVGAVPQTVYAETKTEGSEVETEGTGEGTPKEEGEESKEEVEEEKAKEVVLEEPVEEENTKDEEGEESEAEDTQELDAGEGVETAIAENDSVEFGSSEDFTWTSGDNEIKLENNLPEGGKIKVESKSNVEVTDKTVLAAYDISILVNDEETQPTDAVTVTITDAALSGKSTVNVYHFADDSTTADLVKENAVVKDNTVSFEAKSFSVYALTDGSTLDIASITLEDTKDGYLTATFKDSKGKDITEAVNAAKEKGELTFTWSKDEGEVRESALDSTPNKINVSKDKGSQRTYQLTVGSDKSNQVKVGYYTELVNGSFEDPEITAAYNDKMQDANIMGWFTTATNHHMEFGRYDMTAHGAKDDKHDDSVGKQYAELNADQVGALYQDVLTDGGSELNWSLLHRATTRTSATRTDGMYVVIMSTKDAETLIAGNSGTIMQTVVKDLGSKDSATDVEYTLTTGTNKGKTVKITYWTVTTKTTGRDSAPYSCEADGPNAVSSETTGWAEYSGKYTVPQGQYLTRLFFASATGTSDEGNLLDDVSFSQKVDYSVEYWVYNTKTKQYDLQKTDTETGRVEPGTTIGAKKVDAYKEKYNFMGSVQGKISAGSDANPTKEDITFDVSGSNKVLSLYFSDAIKVSGKITWVDGDKKDGDRPDVVVELLNEDGTPVLDENGKAVTTTVSADGDGTYSFNNLDKNKTYKTRLKTVDGYTVETDPANPNNYTCTKSKKVTSKLVWDDGGNADGARPKTVTLTFKGTDGKTYERTVDVTEDGSYSYDIDDLPQYDENGDPITYTLNNLKIDGYEVEITGNEEDGFTINCKHEVKKTSGSGSGKKNNGGGYANVDFYLVDNATSKPLTGGVYGLYTSTGELVGTYTTDANGHIQFPNLKGGTYYLMEITSPDGYAVNGDKLYFTVDGTPIAVMQTNTALAGAAAAGTTADANAAANGQGAEAGAASGAAVGGATGDSSHMMVYGATAAVAALILAVWFVMNRKRANG